VRGVRGAARHAASCTLEICTERAMLYGSHDQRWPGSRANSLSSLACCCSVQLPESLRVPPCAASRSLASGTAAATVHAPATRRARPRPSASASPGPALGQDSGARRPRPLQPPGWNAGRPRTAPAARGARTASTSARRRTTTGGARRRSPRLRRTPRCRPHRRPGRWRGRGGGLARPERSTRIMATSENVAEALRCHKNVS